MSNKINLSQLTLEELAALVSTKLHEHNIEAILVGGGCVSIYSHNAYQSYDLDYVTHEDLSKVAKALKELNFTQNGRNFSHPDTSFYVEFIVPPVAVGNKPVTDIEHRSTKFGVIKMLTPTDSLKDRLASYYYWDDTQALDQAYAIWKTSSKMIDLQDVKNWSKEEGHLDKFNHFYKRIT